LLQVNIFEAKNRLSQLIRAARAGEEVIIAHRGEPVARLVPAEETWTLRGNQGNARMILDWLNDHPLPAYARRSAQEIDADIDAERASWD
jgi:prevent-host-death family protein